MSAANSLLEQLTTLADRVKTCRSDLAQAEQELKAHVENTQKMLNEALGDLRPSEGGRPRYRRGERLAAVGALLKESLTQEQIAGRLNITVDNAHNAIKLIEKQTKARPMVGPPVHRAVVVSAAVVDDNADDFGVGGDITVDKLIEAVKVQQQGVRGKLAYLITAEAKGHLHTAELDIFGDGKTLPDKNGHVHAIKRFVVRTQANHAHGLTVLKPARP